MSLLPRTLAALLAQRVQTTGDAVAYRYFEGPGTSRSVSFRELGERVQSFALGLASLGVERGTRVCILGNRGPEWPIADLGALVAGGTTVGLSPETPRDRVEAMVRDLGCNVAICGTRRTAEILVEVQKDCTALKRVIGWGRGSSLPGVLPFGQVCLMGNDLGERDSLLSVKLFGQVEPEDPAVVLCETGDQASSRSVVLSHDNCCFSARALATLLGANESDETVCHLPMHHPTERLFGTFLRLSSGMATHILASRERLFDMAAAVRPTLFIASAETLGLLRQQWLDALTARLPMRRKLLPRATQVGIEAMRRRLGRQAVGPLLGLRAAFANRIVLSSARECLGGRLRLVCTTGSPASIELLEFFEALGIRALQGWGVSECSGLCAINPLDMPRHGSIGRPVPGIEVRVSGQTGLRTRGPHVCLGYADGQGLQRAADGDGWLTVHSRAEQDDDGYLWLE